MASTGSFWKRVRDRERRTVDGADKNWVHAVPLAWQRHDGFNMKLAGRAKDRQFLRRSQALLRTSRDGTRGIQAPRDVQL